MALMGLDIGTSGCKCSIFDLEGNIKSTAYEEYATEHPRPGWIEMNPLKVWQAVKKTIFNANQFNSGERVKAVCISSFGESAIPIDKDGNVLYNSLMYTDPRGKEQVQTLVNRLGFENIMKDTGLPAHHMYTIGKIMWIKENLPAVYDRTWKFLLYGDYVNYKLTGLTVIDYSLASRTMAMNVVDKKWEAKIFDAADVDRHMFSDISPSGRIISTVKQEIAEELGLLPTTLVVTGGHDQACAALGGGILKKGLAIDSMGSVECITPLISSPVFNSAMLHYRYNYSPHVQEGQYLTFAVCFSGGSLLKWYRDSFASHLINEAKRTGKSIYQLLDEKAAEHPTDLIVIPHFAGSGTPHMNANSKGAILGISYDTQSKHVYRALMEGVTYEMLYNLECLEKVGVNVETLRAVGGGAKSDLWLQIKADIMGRAIQTLQLDEAGTLGAAMLAGYAIGEYESLEEATDRLVKVKKEYFPSIKNHKTYQEKYEEYKIYSNKLIRVT